jgi:tetratricopeptide (TPR) repeat protein
MLPDRAVGRGPGRNAGIAAGGPDVRVVARVRLPRDHYVARPQQRLSYDQALPIRFEVGDRAGEATTLNNIGMLHNERGDLDAAMRSLKQALPILREVGDRVREPTTLANMAAVRRSEGRLDEAVSLLEQVVRIEGEMGHPELESKLAVLTEVRAELAAAAEGSAGQVGSPVG